MPLMIIKDFIPPVVWPSDRFLAAGLRAEKRMAYYLRHLLADEATIRVFNHLRLRYRDETFQIDHLVLHPFGFHVIESKSISGEIRVDSAGDFHRVWNGNVSGMASPIVQARMQTELLAKLLNGHKKQLRRLVGPLKLQGMFSDERFSVLVAISDEGRIEPPDKRPPELFKADRIVEQIRKKIALQESFSGTSAFIKSFVDHSIIDKFIARFQPEELERVAHFLVDQHEKVATTAPSRETKIGDRRTFPTPSWISEKKIGPPALAASRASVKIAPVRDNKPWNPDEKARLIQAFRAGRPTAEVAAELRRTASAVRIQAVSLRLIRYRSEWK
jgi:hypothetical protein